MTVSTQKISARQKEIVSGFFKELNVHMRELRDGQVVESFEINDIASLLHIHPTHLSDTIRRTTGRSPCDFYEEGLMEIAKQLLLETNKSISEIAHTLTFDPSNFTKFFKH